MHNESVQFLITEKKSCKEVQICWDPRYLAHLLGCFWIEKVKGYPNMPSKKGVTSVKFVWMSRKVTSKFNIPGITPTWNTSTWGSRWFQEVWMTFLNSHLSWDSKLTSDIFPTLTDLCHVWKSEFGWLPPPFGGWHHMWTAPKIIAMI